MNYLQRADAVLARARGQPLGEPNALLHHVAVPERPETLGRLQDTGQRSFAVRALQAGQALEAAAIARSASVGPQLATSASLPPSAGFRTSKCPIEPSAQAPSM